MPSILKFYFYFLNLKIPKMFFLTYIWAVDLAGQESLPCMWCTVLSVQGWACVGAGARWGTNYKSSRQGGRAVVLMFFN